MGFAHIAMAVRDVARTERFLEETLGWQPIKRPQNIARPARWLAMGGGQEVHLIEVSDFAPSTFEREYGRHLAVDYPVAGFPALQERLKSLGAEVFPAERETPFPRFFFRSPDGYVFEVVAAERTPEV